MTTQFADRIASRQPWIWAGLAAVIMSVAACTGGSGNQGEPGPTGPTGPGGGTGGTGVPISSAKELFATINHVSVPDDGRPTVDLYIVDEQNRPVTGLPAANIRFVLARLEPAFNARSSTWHAITRLTEAFPGSPAPTPADRVTGSGPKNQATTETATAGTWVDNQNGFFSYKFARDLKSDAEIPYDASLPHRVGLEIRTSPDLTPSNIPTNNAVYTFIPGTDAQLQQSGREIVDNDTCNACHDNLTFHGGARFDLQYCAMCHESYSYDAQSGNSIDLKVMIHKIHAGETLPTVEAGGFYGIFGRGNTFADLGETVYPQDKRNCTTCHEENDADTPQASNWRLTVNREACGACHDDVDFATGTNHGGVVTTDDMCSTCHGPNATVQNGELRPQVAHIIPEQEAAKAFKYEVVKVQGIKLDGSAGDAPCDASATACKVLPGEYAKVTVKVSNPLTGATYKITDPAFVDTIPCTPTPPSTTCNPTTARLRARVAYTTINFTNPGTGNTPAQPIQIDFLSSAAAPAGAPAAAGGLAVLNADGSYSKAGAAPLPAGLIGGSGEAFLEGRTIVNVSDTTTPEYAEIGVTSSAGVAFPITDGTPVARRSIIDVQRCDDCHLKLSFHGDNRNDNTELCATCHNPEFAAGDTLATGRPLDFKMLIHGIHAATYNFGGESFAHIKYPGQVNNCEGCHQPDTYYPVDPTTVFATSLTRGTIAASPVDDAAITPNAAICSSCHTSSAAAAHMELGGGSFNATKNANGTSNEAPLETCGVCHGAGQVYDVKVEHGVGEFRYNEQ